MATGSILHEPRVLALLEISKLFEFRKENRVTNINKAVEKVPKLCC